VCGQTISSRSTAARRAARDTPNGKPVASSGGGERIDAALLRDEFPIEDRRCPARHAGERDVPGVVVVRGHSAFQDQSPNRKRETVLHSQHGLYRFSLANAMLRERQFAAHAADRYPGPDDPHSQHGGQGSRDDKDTAVHAESADRGARRRQHETPQWVLQPIHPAVGPGAKVVVQSRRAARQQRLTDRDLGVRGSSIRHASVSRS
jgi:hypothetical protein